MESGAAHIHGGRSGAPMSGRGRRGVFWGDFNCSCGVFDVLGNAYQLFAKVRSDDVCGPSLSFYPGQM